MHLPSRLAPRGSATYPILLTFGSNLEGLGGGATSLEELAPRPQSRGCSRAGRRDGSELRTRHSPLNSMRPNLPKPVSGGHQRGTAPDRTA